ADPIYMALDQVPAGPVTEGKGGLEIDPAPGGEITERGPGQRRTDRYDTESLGIQFNDGLADAVDRDGITDAQYIPNPFRRDDEPDAVLYRNRLPDPANLLDDAREHRPSTLPIEYEEEVLPQ